jgi:NAD(P)-dependent dehydrogenase (short-subunit alcohol dehydrogenase family)
MRGAVGLLEGKVAIVTGAAGRLGSASAAAILLEGGAVLATDRDVDGLEKVKAGEGAEDRLSTYVCDITSEDQVAALVAACESRFGGLDILLNNAGAVGLEHNADLLELDVETWDTTMAVNLRGVMLGCKHAVPAMRRRGGGSIINISSSAAFVGDVRNNAYCASKAGVVALTRNVAAAYGKDLIRCNAIAPGIHMAVDDLKQLESAKGAFTSDALVRLEDHCMLPRLGAPEDIANAVVFLASDRSSYITAQTLMVNGGLTHAVPHYADTKRLGSVYLPAEDDK